MALKVVGAAPRASLARPTLDSRAAELGWLLGVGLVALGLCALPYLVAATLGPPELERLGTFWFVRDFSQYQAAMREAGLTASWLVHDRFTAEPHAPALIYPLYVALGKLAAATGLDGLLLFSGLEWLGRAALLGALYAFAATFLPRVGQRRLALLLAAGSLGLAGWAVPLHLALERLGAGQLARLLPSTINVYLEISSFGVFLSAPHLMLGLALTLLCAPLYLRARAGGPWWLLALGVTVSALALLHPFTLPVLVSVLLADAALGTPWRAWRSLRPWLPAAVALAAAAPLAAYNGLLFQLDPFWSGTYGAQNAMPAPPPWALPADFGVVLLAAPAAWPALRAWPAERRRLLLLWVGLGLVWMYAPVPYQRRFAFGAQPALAVLAAAGLLAVNRWMRERRWGPARRRLVNDGLAAAALTTSILVYLSLLASAARNSPAEVYLWSRPEADAARWLAAHSGSDDVVLASTPFANPLVGAIDGRVVHGHVVATRASAAKEALVRRFYSADCSRGERSDLLRRSAATVVALGPRERALGASSLAGQPELELVYDRGGVQWYRVRPSPAS